MKVFLIRFNGHYPVGAFAIVVAPHAAQARVLFWNELEPVLRSQNPDIVPEEIDLTKEGANIIANGDY